MSITSKTHLFSTAPPPPPPTISQKSLRPTHSPNQLLPEVLLKGANLNANLHNIIYFPTHICALLALDLFFV